MKKSALFVAIVFVLFALPAMASSFTPPQHETVSFPLSPGSQLLTFDKFDMGPGYTLTGVYMKYYITIGSFVTAENDSAVDGIVNVSLTGNSSATGAGLSATALLNTTETSPSPLAPTDGVTGSGPDFWDLGYLGDEDTQYDSLNSGLAAFIGPGTFDIAVNGNGGYAFSGIADATLTISEFGAEGYVEIVYEYTQTQVPEPGTIILAGTCLAGMVGIVRRKLKK